MLDCRNMYKIKKTYLNLNLLSGFDGVRSTSGKCSSLYLLYLGCRTPIFQELSPITVMKREDESRFIFY